jgi:hypothetical protein
VILAHSGAGKKLSIGILARFFEKGEDCPAHTRLFGGVAESEIDGLGVELQALDWREKALAEQVLREGSSYRHGCSGKPNAA